MIRSSGRLAATGSSPHGTSALWQAIGCASRADVCRAAREGVSSRRVRPGRRCGIGRRRGRER
eukprot:9010313-Alexandrium_andersonii.AAC.1